MNVKYIEKLFFDLFCIQKTIIIICKWLQNYTY
nr:MAG TPA: hypothetical protein [Caudoviricetes sp.]